MLCSTSCGALAVSRVKVGLVAVLLLGMAAPPYVEWLPLGETGGRSRVYRTVPLSSRNTAITAALVMIHGGGGTAAEHFSVAVDAARRAGVLDTTLVVAPRIPSNADDCHDGLDEREINWGCHGNNGWPAGGSASGDDRLTSYDFVDEILRRLADDRLFPNLETIVVAGHSAGGQFTVRYAMSNQVHDALGVRVRYVVSNPSHYAYPDGSRPFDASTCRAYDDWPYGLRNRRGYAARLTEGELRRQLARRPVTYVLGAEDTMTTGGLDTTCAAMAQGPFRLARGQAFARYVNEHYDAGHSLVIVRGCGHNPSCVFTAPAALPVLFPSTARPR